MFVGRGTDVGGPLHLGEACRRASAESPGTDHFWGLRDCAETTAAASAVACIYTYWHVEPARTRPISDRAAFLSAYTEADDLLRGASRSQLHEDLRLLACQLAYAERYREPIPLDELVERIAAAPQDPAGEAIASAGVSRLAEILRLLNVEPAQPASNVRVATP